MARRNTFEIAIWNNETSSKAIWIVYGSRQSIRCDLQTSTSCHVENPWCIPYITINALQRNRKTWTWFPWTSTQANRWRRGMEGQANHQTKNLQKKETISGAMERICISTRLMGRQKRIAHTRVTWRVLIATNQNHLDWDWSVINSRNPLWSVINSGNPSWSVINSENPLWSVISSRNPSATSYKNPRKLRGRNITPYIAVWPSNSEPSFAPTLGPPMPFTSSF